jgi:xanthine phosphoribosyltransferase
MKETIIEYDVINSITKSLALRLSTSKKKFTHIIGISKGGLLPSIIFGHIFDARVLALGIKSYNNKDNGDIEVYQDIDLDYLDKDSIILVVDDICDSGKTIEFVKKKIGDRFRDAVYVSLFAKKQTQHIVDDYGMNVNNDSWLVFPWEV